MSTRTKSFFDQNNSKKQRPQQWHRPPDRAPLNETSNNVAPPKPPIPPTSQAKSKLKAFQFIPGHPDGSEGNGSTGNKMDLQSGEPENAQQQSVTAGKMDKGMRASSDQPVTVAIAPVPELPRANTYPSTPGTRLPLEDLIGNYDERKAEPQRDSPEEVLGWIPNSSSTLLTPNRKRKRARSSSPSSCPNTSSQRQEQLAPACTAAPAERNTTEADPAADLWERYENSKQDGDSTLPDFSYLMFQASPRAIETPARGGGFRRWASTGNEWPTSKKKQKRTHGSRATILPQDVPVAHPGERSKFADMLKKVEESLATQRLAKEKSKAAADGPSSSSPLPETGASDTFSAAPAASPLETRQNAQRLEAPHVPSKPNAGKPDRPIPAVRVVSPSRDIAPRAAQPSDCTIPTPLCLKNKVPMPAYKRPSICRTPSTSVVQRQMVQAQRPPPDAAQSAAPRAAPALVPIEDEFGDDFDLTAEDLEELAIQPPLRQQPLYQIPQHPNPPPQQVYDETNQCYYTVPDETKAARAITVIDLDPDDEGDDEFGIGDIDEASFAAAEIDATQAFRPPSKKRSPRKAGDHSQKQPLASPTFKSSTDTPGDFRHLQRYIVKQVVDGEYTNAKGRRCPEKVLLAELEHSHKTTAITLRDSWTSTSVLTGNTIHVASLRQIQSSTLPGSPPGQITVSDTDTSSLLIVHPDHMLSATTIADSFDCIRKAVLQDRIKATGETSKAMVYGKILHEIFQQALSANRWDDDSLADLVERTVHNHIESLWELGLKDTVLAVEEINAKMGELSSWARIFVAEMPSEVALVDDKQSEKVWMSISKLIAIEEHIWSPFYGLKGNIDATVQTTLVDHPKEAAKKLIVPFEVKTGRKTQSPAHRAQTALYTLLLSDRYDVTVQAGILYYLESSAMSRIAPPVNEIRQMIQQRNRLAAYLHRAKYPTTDSKVQIAEPQTQEIEESGLPGLLKNPFKCGRCYAQQSCFSYHALVENGTAETAGMAEDGKKNHAQVWHEAVGHLQLSSKDCAQADKLKSWFANWDRLLTFEESDFSKLRKELWTMDSSDREACGRCFGHLVIEQDLTSTAAHVSSSIVDGIEGSGGKINRFAYTFTKATRLPGHSFVQGTQLTVGEPIVVSSERGQWALANGYVIAATKHNITVAVDRRLGNARQRDPHFDGQHNQAFRGIMTVGADTTVMSLNASPTLYRLDKDEFSNGLALVRNNLVDLMSSHPIHSKLREQVILGKEPEFRSTSSPARPGPSQLGEMNEDQTAAVAKVLSAEDYALILGMPGTGKTTTIAHIIRALLAEQKSILLASFTHTAVDNILLKIRDIAPANSILRLGVPAKINSQVQEFCQLAATSRKTIDEVESAYMGCQIVATTCMGTHHALFNRRTFDVCIVDEASQITLPTSLGPLLHARKFVLVGDHYQLPPLVQNRAALEGGLDVSLFRQLTEKHPQGVAALRRQYRMCEDIMSLSNALIYDGQLQCGNDTIAQRTLPIGSLEALSAFHTSSATCTHRPCWLETATSPAHKVLFASTDALGRRAHETLTRGKNITNELEATLAAQLVLSLLALGISAKEIGIITLYRSQIALLRQLFRKASIPAEVDIDSADRFQGRDKECIILSMVRANESGTVGELLKDWRRVNVALTRARSKLLVLGHAGTLKNNELLARFLKLCDSRGWMLDLPTDADGCHTFSFASQAASELTALSRTTKEEAHKALSPPSASKATPTGASRSARTSPSKVLRESPGAANRTPIKKGLHANKKPGKVVSGRSSQGGKSKKAMEKIAFEIFEDIAAEMYE